MAELTLQNGIPPEEKRPPPGSADEEMPESSDVDEYSSGSDRSFEAEDDGGDSEFSDGVTSKSARPRRRPRAGSVGHGSRRHKGGSRHKKSFQPYPPKDETNLKRRSMDRKEKESAAAEVRLGGAQKFTIFPVAPFNSTQYLMDEQNTHSSSALNSVGAPKTPSSSNITRMLSPSTAESTPMEPQTVLSLEKKDKEFVDIYTSVHAESLQSLPKEELVNHYMSLEEKVASLQKQLDVGKQKKADGNLEDDVQRPTITVGGDEPVTPSSNSATTPRTKQGISVS